MADPKKDTLKTLTATGLITDRACLIRSICGLGITDATNVFGVYNGFNTNGDPKFRLTALGYTADFRSFPDPLYFPNGCYIDFTTNGAECFVQFYETDQ